MKVQILGCGNSEVSKDRHPTCILLDLDHEIILLDCGFSTPDLLATYDINPDRPTTVFLSHIHVDHFGGALPLATRHRNKNIQPPFMIYGPAQVRARWRSICFGYGAEDIHKYTEVVEFERGNYQAVEQSGLIIQPFEVVHSRDQVCLGYCVKTRRGDKLVFSGDTVSDLRELPGDLLRHAYLLIIDAAAQRSSSRHLNPSMAAMIACELNAKHAVLTHLPGTEMHYEELKNAIKTYESSDTDIQIAKEGMTFII